jgi:hypothetical protein
MSLARFANFVSIMAGVLILMLLSFVNNQILGKVGEVVKQNDANIEQFGGNAFIDMTFAVLTKWGPLILAIGLILLGFWREWQFQRTTQVRQGGLP